MQVKELSGCTRAPERTLTFSHRPPKGGGNGVPYQL